MSDESTPKDEFAAGDEPKPSHEPPLSEAEQARQARIRWLKNHERILRFIQSLKSEVDRTHDIFSCFQLASGRNAILWLRREEGTVTRKMMGQRGGNSRGSWDIEGKWKLGVPKIDARHEDVRQRPNSWPGTQ